MVWCIEHADSADEVIECLAESLSILEVRNIKNSCVSHTEKYIMNNMPCPTLPGLFFTHTTDCFRPQSLKR
jgi:hypothetical protein